MSCSVCAELATLPKPSPAFSFYPKDWLSDGRVRAMSEADKGTYITLLALCWHEGSLPADAKVCTRMCGLASRSVTRVRNLLEHFDVCSCGTRCTHGKLLEQRRNQLTRKEHGKKGASGRWKNGHGSGMARAHAQDMPNDGLPSPSPSPSPFASKDVEPNGSTPTPRPDGGAIRPEIIEPTSSGKKSPAPRKTRAKPVSAPQRVWEHYATRYEQASQGQRPTPAKHHFIQVGA